jgi:hypothetical protein
MINPQTSNFLFIPEIININFKIIVPGFRKTQIKLFQLSHHCFLGEKSANGLLPIFH